MKYIFLHIPKNGGTSLQAILDAQYNPWQIYNIPDGRRKEVLLALKNKSGLAKKFIKVVKGGHFEYGFHTYFKNPEEVVYFAMLRDPIESAISYYCYVKRTPQHYLYDVIVKEDLSFDGFIRRPDLAMEITNGQTKLLAGVDQEEHCTDDLFQKATSHLKMKFFFVGILDYYVETLYALKKQLKWKRKITYNILNVTKDKGANISEETRDYLGSINRFDFEIYNQYKRSFEKRMPLFDANDFEAFKESLVS